MIENNFCLFHVGTRPGEKTTNHAFVSPYTLAYHELEPINEESVFDLKDMKPGPLDETNTSEANILSVVHNHGILRRFLYGGDLQATPQIYMPHRSQKNTLHKIDDLSLPFGKIRLKKKGSDAGHNGLKNINETLSSSNYARLRFGIDNNFRPGYQSDYVLGEFSIEEKKDLIENIELSSEIALNFCQIGIDRTMNKYN